MKEYHSSLFYDYLLTIITNIVKLGVSFVKLDVNFVKIGVNYC